MKHQIQVQEVNDKGNSTPDDNDAVDIHTFIYIHPDGEIKTSTRKGGKDIFNQPIRPPRSQMYASTTVLHIHPDGHVVVLKDRLGRYQSGQVLTQL